MEETNKKIELFMWGVLTGGFAVLIALSLLPAWRI